MEQFDFTVAGGAAAVSVLKFNELPRAGQTQTAVNTNGDELYYGGCGYNVFCALSRLGCRAYPVMMHEHSMLQKRLEEDCARYNLPADGIFAPEKERYYACQMLSDRLGNHITMAYWFGRDAGEPYSGTAMRLKDSFFKDSRMAVLVVGTAETSPAVVEMARKHGLPLVYSYRNDPLLVPKDVLEFILSEVAVLFANEEETAYIERLFGYGSITELFETAKAEIIVTTLGGRGCLVYEKAPEGIRRLSVPVTEAPEGNVDAVGAGDGFVAGFLYGLSRGETPEICARYGSTVSSFVIEKDGSTTNLPTAEEMLARNSLRPNARE